MNKQMTLTIAGVLDREGLVAELWHCDEQWGEIFQAREYLRLALYPSPNQTFWNFDAEDAASAIWEGVLGAPYLIQPSFPDCLV